MATNLVKVKLKVGKVIDGAVWPAGSVVPVPEEDAGHMFVLDEADLVEEELERITRQIGQDKENTEE